MRSGSVRRRAGWNAFDISNISTTHIVASMVCFLDGRPANHLYRRFRINTVQGQDDFASIGEVVRRRYTRALNEAAVATAGNAFAVARKARTWTTRPNFRRRK